MISDERRTMMQHTSAACSQMGVAEEDYVSATNIEGTLVPEMSVRRL